MEIHYRENFIVKNYKYLPKAPTTYRIEKILETKGKGRYKQHLVKWVGYKNPSWIKASQIST